MDTIEKLKILSNDSQYDLACACGSSKDDHRRRGGEGRCFPLKIRREKRITSLEDLGLKGKRLEKAKQYVIFE